MSKFVKTTTSCTALLFVATTVHAALNFEISYEHQSIGGSTSVPDSGSTANYSNTTSVGDYAVFDIQTRDEFGVVTSDYAQLKVTYLTDNGSVGSDLMVGQTVNSQGLTDTGTLSVLASYGSGLSTVSLQFDWYAFGSYVDGDWTESASLLPLQINYTALDIDYDQIVGVAKSDIDNYTLEENSLLTPSDDGSSIVFTDDDARTNVDNPLAAVSFTSNTSGTQVVSMGKQNGPGNALFIFEFRDPGTIAPFLEPETTAVPEPAAAGLLLGMSAIIVTMLQSRRRR